MRIRCGNCKGAHSSVEEVRACAASKTNNRPASPQAKSLAQALGRERVRLAMHEGMAKSEYTEMINGLDGSQTSVFIREMLRQPRVVGMTWDDWKNVAPGRYALRDEHDEVKFYQVGKIFAEGKPRLVWSLAGAPGEFRKTRVYRAEGIMSRIAEDPIAAFALFGQEVGQCGVCNSPLTQKHTRDRGVGDICWEKMQR
ncbi:hypothetical protein SEA_YARA_72 [Streptomyces phage Yara]|nr:hypothetical protein SEA_YARA_72 [Streptomyces phage Yara]